MKQKIQHNSLLEALLYFICKTTSIKMYGQNLDLNIVYTIAGKLVLLFAATVPKFWVINKYNRW